MTNSDCMADKSILADRYLLAGGYRLTGRVGMTRKEKKNKLIDSYRLTDTVKNDGQM